MSIWEKMKSLFVIDDNICELCGDDHSWENQDEEVSEGCEVCAEPCGNEHCCMKD